MLQKISLMNSPFKILTYRGVRVVVETRLFLECDHKRDQALGEKNLKFYFRKFCLKSNTRTVNLPVDTYMYARLSAECSIEGLERSIIKVIWCQREI